MGRQGDREKPDFESLRQVGAEIELVDEGVCVVTKVEEDRVWVEGGLAYTGWITREDFETHASFREAGD